MLTTGRPATIPAEPTTPSPAASTGDPGGPARSTPRCPAAYGLAGGSNGRVTTSSPPTGADQRAVVGAGGTTGSAAADTGASTAASTRTAPRKGIRTGRASRSAAPPEGYGGDLWTARSPGKPPPALAYAVRC